MKKIWAIILMGMLSVSAWTQEVNEELKQLPEERPFQVDTLFMERYVPTHIRLLAPVPQFSVGVPEFRPSHTISPHALPDVKAVVGSMQLSLPSYVSIYSTQNDVPGLMHWNTVNAGAAQTFGRFTLAGNTMMFQGNSGWGMSKHAVSVGGSLSYQVNDRLKVGLVGNAAPVGSPSSYVLMPMMPRNSFGGFAEYMFSDHFGMGVQVEREYNPIRRKWETKRTLYPIFK